MAGGSRVWRSWQWLSSFQPHGIPRPIPFAPAGTSTGCILKNTHKDWPDYFTDTQCLASHIVAGWTRRNYPVHQSMFIDFSRRFSFVYWFISRNVYMNVYTPICHILNGSWSPLNLFRHVYTPLPTVSMSWPKPYRIQRCSLPVLLAYTTISHSVS